MGFGENLRRARDAKGMTQQQVADLMGISKSTYCGYETGKRQPDVAKIKQLSNILGTPADSILETGYQKTPRQVSEGSEEKLGPHQQAIMDAVKDMDDATALAVLNLIRSVKSLRGPK